MQQPPGHGPGLAVHRRAHTRRWVRQSLSSAPWAVHWRQGTAAVGGCALETGSISRAFSSAVCWGTRIDLAESRDLSRLDSSNSWSGSRRRPASLSKSSMEKSTGCRENWAFCIEDALPSGIAISCIPASFSKETCYSCAIRDSTCPTAQRCENCGFSFIPQTGCALLICKW